MKYVKNIFPFFITLALWRLPLPFWNPAGLLAIIPIFYYSFVRPKHFFFVFSLLICFLIDYNMDTLCFWIAMYAAAYAGCGFQSYFDLARQKLGGIYFFMAFFGFAMLICMLWGLTLIPLWLWAWASLWYFVFARLHND